MAPKPEPEYLTIKDCARILNCGYTTIYTLVIQKKIPSLQFSTARGSTRKAYRIKRTDFEEYLKMLRAASLKTRQWKEFDTDGND